MSHITFICLMSFVLQLTIKGTFAGIYLHNPRGSNNRLDERSRDVNNNKNLFDSQNNPRGGYNVGSLMYYQGSTLSVEWTNDNGCSGENGNCEIILQYMCSNKLRDGVITSTIPTLQYKCRNYHCDSDRRYRMHEDYAHYQTCQIRQRNRGLFIADQKMTFADSRSTRANPQGVRYGHECPEERDYYPYWHPSPWKDIAVLTNDVSRCQYYQEESQNVKSRWECLFDYGTMLKINGKVTIPNNEKDCKNFELPAKFTGKKLKPVWKEIPAHGIPAPDCREAPYSRDNHLGNGIGGHPNTYNWTIPSYVEGEFCAMRIRYNLSSTDYDRWTTDSTMNADPKNLNGGTKVPMADKYGFSSEIAAQKRGYIYKSYPEVQIFKGLNIKLWIAMPATNNFRTFQDRSHSFAVRKLPEGIEAGAKIHNLNVRGQRGNIVQNFPAVEYDFVPNILEASIGDYVHIQWTGSNTINGNNDGQGLAGTDRNNIVLLANENYREGDGTISYLGGKFGHYGRNYPMVAENSTFLGLSKDDVYRLAFLDPGQMRGEMSELDDAGTYFNLPLRKLTKQGTYHYMCTRNNNFSNRDQKGKAVVHDHPFVEASIGQLGGILTLGDGDAKISVPKKAFRSLKSVRIQKLTTEQGLKVMQAVNGHLSSGERYVSDFFVISPEDLVDTNNEKAVDTDMSFSFEMKLHDDSDRVEIYHADSKMTVWTKVDADISGGKARMQAQRGGVFVARSLSNVGMIVGIVIACLVVVAIGVGTFVYFRRNPMKWQAVRTNCNVAKFSLQSKI